MPLLLPRSGRKGIVSISMVPYTTDTVLSGDTIIGYRQLGSGPGLVLLHGSMQTSQHYMRLAAALSSSFTVYLPDRRGRGLSESHGNLNAMANHCKDLEALLARTGAHFVFGSSSGGLIALCAALTQSSIHRVAVYDPALSLHGSLPTSWIPAYEHEVARSRLAQAMVTSLKGLKISQDVDRLPRWLLLPFIKSLLRKEKGSLGPDSVPLETLIPLMGRDVQLSMEMDSTLERFHTMSADVLLLGGRKSPAFVRDALDALQKTLPHVERIEYADLGHDGPDESAPERICKDLHMFFVHEDRASIV